LQAAGLNLPLKLDDARLDWKNGHRSATITRAAAFGAAWSGSVSDAPALDDSAGNNWKFQLRADHLDAADLDLWFGPRARPNWLQRSFLPFSGNPIPAPSPANSCAASPPKATSKRFLSIEKIKLSHARPTLHSAIYTSKFATPKPSGPAASPEAAPAPYFSVPPKYEIAPKSIAPTFPSFPGPHTGPNTGAAPLPENCT